MTGIQDPSDIRQYVNEVWGEANSCMGPNDRANDVVAHVNEQLRGAGIPDVSWHFDSSKGVNAEFDFQTWQMALGSTPYEMDVADNATPEQQEWQVSSVYHEARHAEQWFRMARERIGLGATPEQAAQVMSIPLTIAQWAAQDPILQCDASQYEAEEWYQSVYGAGHDARNATLNDVQNHYQDYRNLPEEHDAWATGDAVTSQMQHPNQ